MEPLGERFWSKVKKGSGGDCWVWTAALVRGYGQYGIGGAKRLASAHRLAYAEAHGLDLADVPLLDHRCHNGTDCPGGAACRHRACVRPDHLVPSTHRDNLLASPLTLAAQNAAKTHCPSGHPYDEENTYRTKGRGLRMCKECGRRRARENQRRRRAVRLA